VGETVHRSQIGRSQVPDLRFGTFQSQASVALRPHLQRFVGVQMIAPLW